MNFYGIEVVHKSQENLGKQILYSVSSKEEESFVLKSSSPRCWRTERRQEDGSQAWESGELFI